MRKNLRESIFVILLMFLFCGLVYWNFKDIFLAGLSFVIFLSSLSSFFFPTSYILDDKEIMIHNIYSQHYNWTRFRRYKETKKGIYLSPYLEPSSMDPYRSIFLFCESEIYSKVLTMVKEKVTNNSE